MYFFIRRPEEGRAKSNQDGRNSGPRQKKKRYICVINCFLSLSVVQNYFIFLWPTRGKVTVDFLLSCLSARPRLYQWLLFSISINIIQSRRQPELLVTSDVVIPCLTSVKPFFYSNKKTIYFYVLLLHLFDEQLGIFNSYYEILSII